MFRIEEPEIKSLLLRGQFGLEKESLRIDADGFLAHTPHPWDVLMYFHPYPDFGAFASASRVQLDVKRENLIAALRGFSLVEPNHAVKAGNSNYCAHWDYIFGDDFRQVCRFCLKYTGSVL